MILLKINYFKLFIFLTMFLSIIIHIHASDSSTHIISAKNILNIDQVNYLTGITEDNPSTRCNHESTNNIGKSEMICFIKRSKSEPVLMNYTSKQDSKFILQNLGQKIIPLNTNQTQIGDLKIIYQYNDLQGKGEGPYHPHLFFENIKTHKSYGIYLWSTDGIKQLTDHEKEMKIIFQRKYDDLFFECGIGEKYLNYRQKTPISNSEILRKEIPFEETKIKSDPRNILTFNSKKNHFVLESETIHFITHAFNEMEVTKLTRALEKQDIQTIRIYSPLTKIQETELKSETIGISSTGGHNIFAKNIKNIVLSGGSLELCLCNTIRDLLKYRKQNLTTLFDINIIISLNTTHLLKGGFKHKFPETNPTEFNLFSSLLSEVNDKYPELLQEYIKRIFGFSDDRAFYFGDNICEQNATWSRLFDKSNLHLTIYNSITNQQIEAGNGDMNINIYLKSSTEILNQQL